MGYNQFVFSSLASRKSIYIEGIGVVSVIRRGSLKRDRKSFRELPHYDLIVTKSSYDVSLKESVKGDYEEWLQSVTKSGNQGRELDIQSCFILKIGKDESVTIVPYDELNLQLNPFAVAKLKPRRKKKGLILLLILFILLCAAGYAIVQFIEIKRTEETKKVVTIIPEIRKEKVVEIEKTPVVVDTLPVIESDSVEVVEPKEDADGFTEPVKGNSYLVVGSFRSLSLARSDAQRLVSYYKELKINTTSKGNGDYINYILTTPSYSDALEAYKELGDKFEKIKGIWVYYMK